MIAENPLALSYILPADVFFLPGDRSAIALAEPMAEVTIAVQAQEPAVSYTAPEIIAAIPPVPVIVQAPTAIVPTPVLKPSVEIKTPEPAPIEVTATAPTFTFKGGFKQKFLVIVNYPDQDLMDPAHLTALESTIKRKEMTLDDAAIFNIGQYPGTDIKAIGRFFKPKRMLLLGRDSFPVNLAEQPLNQLTLLGTCQLLYSYNFTEMMANRDLVKTFWEQMKLL